MKKRKKICLSQKKVVPLRAFCCNIQDITNRKIVKHVEILGNKLTK